MTVRQGLCAATLAVGTEVTDGQITDRNSAWISKQLVSAGIDVVEHRAVPDDRKKIATALRELSSNVDLLFVTGGLGPTSDDFTRDLVAEVFKSPLEFHEPSWQRIVKRFEARGAVAKPIQRQQCFFPCGSQVLENPAGTANAFSMPVVYEGRKVFVVILPGPPAEIAAVWDLHLSQKIEALTPEVDREELLSWETLGPGESEVAEKVEEAIKGSGLRVGYRAHLPYVEVKLWIRRTQREKLKLVLAGLDRALEKWTVARGKDDLADVVIKACITQHVTVVDEVSGGYLQTRLQDRLRVFKKAHVEQAFSGSLSIHTTLQGLSESGELNSSPQTKCFAGSVIALKVDLKEKTWRLEVAGQQSLAIDSTPLYNFGTERGRAYAVEKAFQLLTELKLLESR